MFAPSLIDVRRTGDGSVVLSNRLELGPYPETLTASLRRRAEERPGALFLAEREGAGWRGITYGEMWRRTDDLGARLLGAGCSPDRPVLILAPNSIAHAEIMLAAIRVGVPIAPISTAFALASADLERLRYVTGLVTPRLAAIPAEPQYDAAAAAVAELTDQVVRGWAWDSLPALAHSEVRRAEASVGASTVAKLLFTSGSTDKPKVVPNTHRMMCSNQAAMAVVWPCIAAAPPVIIDWLPWNHTFGGNFSFNLALTHGGTLYIDAGKPTPSMLATTLANLRDIAPTVYYNVPAGFEALLPHLENDAGFARHFFSRLSFVFSAGAALPQKARDRLDAAARGARGTGVPILTGWGSTETAPCATVVYSASALANNIGLPIPGTEVKLVPDQGKFELRVRGPNVMVCYWRQGDDRADTFDEDGFYRMGDAGVLIDPDRPEAGIAFDGRVAENFKLSSGTWVNVGALRLALIDAARPLIQDVVITGHDRDEIGILIFPNLAACRETAGFAIDERALTGHACVIERLRRTLQQHNLAAAGSSGRVAAFIILDSPPCAEAHEITDKGYVNQRTVLKLRAADVLRVHGPEGHRV